MKKKQFEKKKRTLKKQEIFDKISWKAGTMIYPLPSVMVSCGDIEKDYNIITIAWTGIISTEPAMCYISVRPERYSYKLLKESMEFCINLTTKKLAYATDWCGVKSGRDFDKFKEMNLKPIPSPNIKAPMIAESPVNIECKVREIKELGSHHMFISEIIAVHASEEFFNPETGEFKLYKSEPIVYSHGKYYETGNLIGKFGFSVKKKKRKK